MGIIFLADNQFICFKTLRYWHQLRKNAAMRLRAGVFYYGQKERMI